MKKKKAGGVEKIELILQKRKTKAAPGSKVVRRGTNQGQHYPLGSTGELFQRRI